ncbi:MAG: metallopeptidase family protein [Clostridiales bacterium]|jgi:hypothetical protein|nr:metallopeptidase family protein [Clostridiales bacterium]
MVSFDEAAQMLDEIAGEFPAEFYKELNGGINLLPDTKMHPQAGDDGALYIVGEYFRDLRGLGRYINIYFGSFEFLYGSYPKARQKAELRRILRHEFTHHIESLAGERGLEIKDFQDLERYKRRKGRRRE